MGLPDVPAVASRNGLLLAGLLGLWVDRIGIRYCLPGRPANLAGVEQLSSDSSDEPGA